jgi:hypothetical protein
MRGVGTIESLEKEVMRARYCGIGTGLLLGFSLLTLRGAPATEELLPPFRVSAGDSPIDVEVGHAAPLMMDIDGDGKPDLLVGQFGKGKLRIYHNVGSNTEPRFDEFAWFKAGSADGMVPAG